MQACHVINTDKSQLHIVRKSPLKKSSFLQSHCSKSSFFVQKFNFYFPIFLGKKTRENAAVLDFLAVDNFDFTRKFVKKNWVKNS